jgi:hypothetical protein
VLAEDEPGRAELDDGTGLTSETLRRLACDCGIRISLDDLGATLDLGRRTRSIPPALRRAIEDRDDGRCRFGGCSLRGRLQVHHRRHWARGGTTDKHNCFLVCRYHHKVLHEGRWHAEGDADGQLTFVSPTGRRVPEAAPPGPRTDPDAIRRAHAATGPRITADTIIPKWYAGTRLDLHHAVSSLWYLDPPDLN